MADGKFQRLNLIEVDLSKVSSVSELHQKLADALGFPRFYGKNWNAFWDAITGLVNMPEHLVITGWNNIETRWPHDAAMMKQCLQDLNEQLPSEACAYELR